jgi:hypothetical protein
MICARFNLNLTRIFQVKYWLFYRFPQVQTLAPKNRFESSVHTTEPFEQNDSMNFLVLVFDFVVLYQNQGQDLISI